jgi:hypothetical protein
VIEPADMVARIASGEIEDTQGKVLFGLFCPLRFAETHARSPTVLVDESDAGRLSSSLAELP